jgi:hypothetical protein
MTKIEEIVFESIELGIRENLYERVDKLSTKQEYKYVELHKIYEDALKKEKNVLFENSFVNESGNS